MSCKRSYIRVFAIVAFCAIAVEGKRFYDDDPVSSEPRPVGVGELKKRKLSDYYDLFSQTLGTRGERSKPSEPIRAKNISTLDEVWNGAWYMNRHYWHPLTTEQLLDGPGGRTPPSATGTLTIVGAKNEGITPGFTIVDDAKRMYFVKFDPPSNPELMSAAEIIGTKLFHALGYHVPDVYLFDLDSSRLRIGEGVKIPGRDGRPRSMTDRDLAELLTQVHRSPSGKIRSIASLRVPGRDLGPFRYYGMRADDPNDFIPHEHRRELRGLRVFAAWLNHDDSRAVNTFDALVEENGLRFVRHYLMDFGSILGSGTSKPTSKRSGNEYLFGWGPAAKQFFSFGLAVPAWEHGEFRYYPSVGYVESKAFDARTWVPEYPNPAFENMLADDAFWAAKQLVRLTPEQVRAVVHSAKLSDAGAEKYLTDVIVERRRKTIEAFLTPVIAIDRFGVEGGRLVFDDVGRDAGLQPAKFDVQWNTFNNDTGATAAIAGAATTALPKHECGADSHYLMSRMTRASDSAQTQVFVRCRGGVSSISGVTRLAGNGSGAKR